MFMVHSSDLSVMDTLLSELEDLGHYAELVLGAKAIALYFVPEELYRAEIYNSQKSSLQISS
jgi:hypothetical protein